MDKRFISSEATVGHELQRHIYHDGRNRRSFHVHTTKTARSHREWKHGYRNMQKLEHLTTVKSQLIKNVAELLD
jgi:hypothetical protein